VAVLLATITLGGLTVFLTLGARADGTAPAQARLMPAETLAFVTVNGDRTSRQWVQAGALLDRFGSTVRDGTREETLERAAGEYGLRWEDDLASLIGAEASVGVLDYEERRAFALIATSDAGAAWERAQTALETAVVNAGDAAVYRNRLNGIDVATYQEDGETALIAGMLDSTLMLATDVAGATRLIDVFRGSAPNLADRPEYARLAAVAGGEYLAFAFVDGRPALDGVLSDDMLYDALEIVDDVGDRWDLGSPDSFSLDSGVVAARGVLNAAVGRPMAIRLAVDGSGVVLHQYQEGAGRADLPAYDPLASDRVPAEALVYVAGYDLWNRFEQPIVAAMASALSANGDDSVEESRAEARAGLGFDPEFHILSLLDRRFAASLVIDLTDPDWLTGQAFFETNDPVHLGGSLAELDRVAVRHGIFVEERPVADQPATVWTGWGESAAVHAADSDQVAAALGRDVEGVAVRAQTASLRDLTTFQAVMAALPAGATAYVYVDLIQVVDALETEDNLPDLGEVMIEDWRAIDAAGVAVRQGQEFDETIVYLHLRAG
jgi:hypothetical protein